MANEITIRPEEPITQVVEYSAGVLKSLDGTEQRFSRHLPRQSYSFELVLPEDQMIRHWRAALYRNLNVRWRMPVWHEEVLLSADVAASATTLPGDFEFSDLAAGDLVLIAEDEDTWEVATVSTRADSQLTISSGLSDGFPAGSAVVPLELSWPADGSRYRRFPINAARFPLDLTLDRQRALGGQGAPTLETFDSLPVLDRRPLNEALAEESFTLRRREIDYGGRITALAEQGRADVVTPRTFLIDSPSERQWWKAFLDTIDGPRKPFLTPTWRPDLVLASQPAGSATEIVVSADPNFKTQYEGHVEYLQLETADELIWRKIASVSVAGGEATITLTTALPGSFSTIDTVSFLERSRMGSRATFRHFSGQSFVAVSVHSVMP